MQDAGGKIQLCNLHLCNLQSATRNAPTLGHYLTPQTLLELASGLNAQAPPAWMVTIPGNDFDIGEGFSEVVSQLLKSAPEIATMITEAVRLRE